MLGDLRAAFANVIANVGFDLELQQAET